MSETPRLVRLRETRKPNITNTPPLPIVDFAALGHQAPQVQSTPDSLPKADVVVLCWGEREWAPIQHVFVSGDKTMPYADGLRGSWPAWKEFSEGAPSHVGYWGSYRLVTVGNKKVLLFKSNAHLDEGQSLLEGMMTHVLDAAKPSLVLSTGTAGGCRRSDPIGTVNITNACTMYETKGKRETWPKYTSTWRPNTAILKTDAFKRALLAVPTTDADIVSLVTQFNDLHKTNFTRAELDPLGLNMGASHPAVNDLTAERSLLTATSFVVATTDGNLSTFSCVEMDDAVVEKICGDKNVTFGSVRNLSDPIQNSTLPVRTQGDWGSFIYEAYGVYTSFNGALAAWAVLAG